MQPTHTARSARIFGARRILVLGPSGAGKSHLTERLSRLLDLEPVHLDAFFWQPGPRPRDTAEWEQVQRRLVNGPRWIMDGTYENTLDLRVPAADLILLVEDSRLSCLWRAARRRLRSQRGVRRDAPQGDRFDLHFLKYVWQYPRVSRPRLFGAFRRHGKESRVILLQGPRQIEELLEQMEAALA